MHYKLLLDPAKYLQPSDFPKPRDVTIAKLSREELPVRDGEPKASAPMLWVQGKDGHPYDRPMKIPKSVLHGLSVLFGTETDAWVGKKITVFATHCMAFGDKEECLRVIFPADTERAVRAWLKKRKVNPSAYMIGSVPAAQSDADTARSVEQAAAKERGEA